MATRKRARSDEGQFTPDNPATPAVNEAYDPPLLTISVDSLAAFMEVQHPDRERLAQALALAIHAASATLQRSISSEEPHPIRHGIHMLASQLLLANQLEEPPQPAAVPLVIRGIWASA